MGASGESSLAMVLAEWAGERGWEIAIGEDPGQVPGLRSVLAVAPDAGSIGPVLEMSGLAVVVVDPGGMTAGGNLSTIGGSIRRDQAGFLAGALAGLSSESGWVGRIDETGGAESAIYQMSFLHGLRFGCPRCQMVSLAAGEATLDRFRSEGVDVVWAVPGPAADAALAPLAEGGMWIVWAEVPPLGILESRIAGGVGFAPEVLVRQALDSILAGDAGRDWPYDVASGGLGLAGLNNDAVSPGRQRLLREAEQALATGALDPGVDPQTGEER
jgi:hypothetical protein